MFKELKIKEKEDLNNAIKLNEDLEKEVKKYDFN